jgi:hypothetical protein
MQLILTKIIKYRADLPYWRGTADTAEGGKLLYERSGLQQKNNCRKIFEANFDYFTGKIFVVYDPKHHRINVPAPVPVPVPDLFSTVFQQKKFFLQNLAFSILEAALFPRKLASIYDFLTFVLHFMLDTGPNPVPEQIELELGKKFFVGLLKGTDEKTRIQIRIDLLYGSMDPDPSQIVTDPEH